MSPTTSMVLGRADLFISDIWPVGSSIYYTLSNLGVVGAAASKSSLTVDGSFVLEDSDASIAGGVSRQESFSYAWMCSGVSDVVRVCADSGHIVPESDETNNCRTETWMCPTTTTTITTSTTTTTSYTTTTIAINLAVSKSAVAHYKTVSKCCTNGAYCLYATDQYRATPYGDNTYWFQAGYYSGVSGSCYFHFYPRSDLQFNIGSIPAGRTIINATLYMNVKRYTVPRMWMCTPLLMMDGLLWTAPVEGMHAHLSPVCPQLEPSGTWEARR